MTATFARWDELYQDKRHRLQYPSEHVVRWLFGLPSTGGVALDIGCGWGRHSDVIEEKGFMYFGVDTAGARSIRGDMRDLPWDDNTFDLALAYGVFYYGTPDDGRKAVQEMHRVLKPGGHAFACVRTIRDWRFIYGQPVAPQHVRMKTGDEAGMDIHFLRETDIQERYGMFSRVSWELAEWTTLGRQHRNSDWLIAVTK